MTVSFAQVQERRCTAANNEIKMQTPQCIEKNLKWLPAKNCYGATGACKPGAQPFLIIMSHVQVAEKLHEGL